jgi:hypothetical protein
MKILWLSLWILALAGAFALGRFGSGTDASGPSSASLFQEVLDEYDPVTQAIGISSFLRRLNAENVDEVAEIIEAEKNWLSDSLLLQFMMAWTGFDDLGAVDWAFSRTGTFKRRMTEAVIESLAFRNPTKAISTIDALDDPAALDRLHDQLITGWARSEFKDDLTGYVMKIPRNMDRQRATRVLALEVLKDGTDALIAWAEGIPEDAERGFKRIAFRRVASEVAGIDPALAAQWIDGHQERPYAKIAREAISKRWLDSDPAAAMVWLLTLPAGEERNEELGRTYTTWFKKDSKAATVWLRSMSTVEGIDPVILVVVRRHSKPRPDLALDWAHLIHEDELRRNALIGVGRRWLERNPRAFKAWLPRSGLQGDIRREIMTPSPDHQGGR